MIEKNPANKFLLSNNPDSHVVETPMGDLLIYVKQLSWIEQQEAMTKFVDFKIVDGEPAPQIDLGGYWRYVFQKCIVKTEPEMSSKDLLNLKPEVGAEIQKHLPSLTKIVEQFAGGEANPLG